MSNKSILQPLHHPLFTQHQISVFIKRDDLIHPIISGNKWRKLKYNIQFAKNNNYKGILSFGGSYSNHIHALAFACQQNHLQSIGIIRGEPEYASNYTLASAQQWGMTLQFVDRKTYRKRHDDDYLLQLKEQYPDYLMVPEGGSNHLALSGVAEVCHELNNQIEYDVLMTPVGSAGTISGLIHGDQGQHHIIGVAVLKNADYLNAEIKTLLADEKLPTNNWQLLTQYNGGGYAKFSEQDKNQLLDFIKITQIPFEPVYSGKMILALLDLVSRHHFQAGQRIVLLHTGGLQGLMGLIEQKRIKANEWSLPPELLAQ